jgi:hypothetical protein
MFRFESLNSARRSPPLHFVDDVRTLLATPQAQQQQKKGDK